MDFDILPQLLIIFSIAGILVIVGRNFSKVKEATREEIFLEESLKEKEEKERFMYLFQRAVRRINKENYQKKIADFWVWFEKFLRKMRIFVLRLDTKMASALERLRQKNVQSIENWKKMAEKNIHKGQGADTGADAMNETPPRKRRKLWGRGLKPLETDAGVAIESAETGESGLMSAADGASASVNVMDSSADMSGTEHRSEEADLSQEVSGLAVEEDMRAREEAVVEVYADAAGSEEESIHDEAEAGAKADNELAVKSLGNESPIINEETEENEGIESAEEELKRTKKEQECIEILMQDPANIKAYWKLGLIYSKRRNYEDALACFRQIVKIDPTYTKAKQKAIELMEKMKNRGK